ncbi:MAG: hypothetical protein CSA49_02710 [Gammaproteobacteria bacterium]|nr:MAG: hypothetical protein CSA49_02710 [Gammaproteobacteria bacterium]
MHKHIDSKHRSVLTADNTTVEELSAYERWELPAMDADLDAVASTTAFTSTTPGKQQNTPAPDSVSDKVTEDAEEIQPLTAEDLEAIRQAAYEEGKEQGQQQGYKAGYDQGYKSGESDLKAALARLAQISRALLEPIEQQDDELENALLQLVENICTRVVYRELKADSSSVLTVVKEALNCLNAGAKRIRIHLNPEDAEFVQQSLTDAGEFDDSWRLLPHATISPGGCIVDTDTAVIDMRAEKRLATVIKQVYERDQQVLQQEQQTEGSFDQLMGEVNTFADDEDTEAGL